MSDDHKNHHDKVWCEDCNKYISDTTRHFQSGILLRNKQTNQQNTQIASGTQHPSVKFDNNTEDALHVGLIVNENTYIKLKVNPTENLEHDINELLSTNYFLRYKHHLSYLAKLSKKLLEKKKNIKDR